MRTSPGLFIMLFALVALLAAGVVLLGSFGDYRAYFPPAALKASITCPEWRKVSAVTQEDVWRYAGIWREFNEPAFPLQAREARQSSLRSYRFTWQPSFVPPRLVRIDEQANGEFWMTAKWMENGPPHQLRRRLTVAETQRILALIERTGIMFEAPADCRLGSDGSRWIFEAVEHGRLQYAQRWTPEEGPVHDVGEAFYELTGWPTGRDAGFTVGLDLHRPQEGTAK